MLDLTQIEDDTEERSNLIMQFISHGDQQGLVDYVNSLTMHELRWQVVSLGNGYLFQESRAEAADRRVLIMSDEAARANTANIALFAERRRLLEKNDELRSILTAKQLARVA